MRLLEAFTLPADLYVLRTCRMFIFDRVDGRVLAVQRTDMKGDLILSYNGQGFKELPTGWDVVPKYISMQLLCENIDRFDFSLEWERALFMASLKGREDAL